MARTLPDDDIGDALRLLEENGSDLSRPLEMDFFAAVPSQAAGDAVAAHFSELNFATSVEQDEESQEWTCYCTKTLVPDYTAVAEIEAQVDAIARAHGGQCDGFGSYGNCDD